ncbi:MAG: hypothetical protein ABIN97_14620 [Ginsengibacter sp.]
MRIFFVLVIFLLSIATKNIAQTITPKSDYSYSSDINYKQYPVTSGFTATNSIGVMGLVLNDAGGDGLPTSLTAITFSISVATGNAVRTAALYANGVKVSSYIQVANGSTAISFSSASLASAADGGTVNLELKVTFKTIVTDNQQMQFTVSSVTALAGGSGFIASDGGGATSPVSGNINKLIVTADRFKFIQQPTEVFAGQIIIPSVTVGAVDVNKNVDSDYVSLIKLNITNPTPSCDTLSGNLVTAVSGIATFSSLAPNVADDSVTLIATGILTSSVPSSIFDVLSAEYKTMIKWNFVDNNTVADGGTNTDYLSRNITASGTNAINFANCGCTGSRGSAAYSTGWTGGLGTKSWEIDFYTSGYWNIKISSRQRSSSTGPRNYKVQFKVTNGSWQDLGTVALADSFRANSFVLPPLDTPSRVYVRWLMNSSTGVSGSAVDDAGENYIDEISVVGIGITLARQLYYRTSGSGDFESSCSWETADSAAGPWVQAKGSPDFSANTITIKTGHTIAINESINLDELIVDAGGGLVLNKGILHILNGASVSGLDIKGTLTDNTSNADGVTFSSDGTWKLGSAATLIKTSNSSAVPYRDKFFSGMSSIPSTANWIIRYTGVNSPAFTTDSTFYPNLIFESTNGAWDPGITAGSYFSGAGANGAYATIKGTLDIGGTNNMGTVKISNANQNAQALLVQGNVFIRQGSELNNIAGTTSGTGFELKGNLSVEGILSVNGGGSGTLKLSGSSLQTVSGGGIINLHNLYLTNTSGISLTRALTIGGTISLIQGTLTPGINAITLNGPVIRTAGNINAQLNTTIFSGTLSQTIPGNTFLNNTLNNLTIGNNVSLSGQDTITGTLSLTGSNNMLTTNGNLTLKSTATGTANVAQIANGNSIAGDVIVERYISAKRAWRFLSIPTNSAQTFKQAWQEGAASTADNLVGRYGTQVTNNSAAWAVNGFDYYSPDGPSVKKYNVPGNSWVGIPNTNNLPAGTGLIKTTEGLMTFVRGDRRSTGVGSTAYATVLRTKGSLYTGVQPAITVIADKSASIGNPYASALDVRNITNASKPGISDFFIVWDPYLANINGNGFGAFQYLYKSGTNYYALPGSGSYPTVDASGTPAGPSNHIESGQAFFVQSISGGTFTFDESAKASANTNPLVFRPVSLPEQHLRTNLYAVETDGSATLIDAALNDFGANYSNGIDEFDAIKALNFFENLAIKNGDKLLAIERRSTIVIDDTIFLNMLKMKVKSYRFEIIGNDFTQPGLTAFLEDSYFNTRTLIDLNGNTIFNFNVINVPGSWNPDRFRIVFKAAESGPLPLTFSMVKAYQKDKDISVEWKVESEKSIKQYVVEKSVNGRQFTNAFTVAAKNNNTSFVNYQWTDIYPVLQNNYYRIKSIGINGEIQYSNIVKVFIGKGAQDITVYPNPVVNGTINLQLINQPKGIYTLRLMNKLGQVISIKEFEHAEGSSTQTMQLNKIIPKGSYQLQVIKPGNNKTNITVLY